MRTSIAISGKTTPEGLSIEQEAPLTPVLRRLKPESPLADYSRYSHDPVHEFLCGSQEIKDDLRRLAAVEQDLPSPSFTPPPTQPRDSNLRLYRTDRSVELRSRKTWERVNSLLSDLGYEEVLISEGPVMEDVGGVFLNVLKSHSQTQKELKNVKMELRATEKELWSLKEAYKSLKSKLTHDHSKAKHKIRSLENALKAAEEQKRTVESEENRDEIDELERGFEQEKLIFVRYFGREARNSMDLKVLKLIQVYESSIKNASFSDNSHLRSENSYLVERIENLEEELRTYRHEIYPIVVKELGLKSVTELPSAVGKMQKVIRAVPSLEAFIRKVMVEVTGEYARETVVDEVVPTLQAWKQRIQYLDSLHSLHTRILGGSPLSDSHLLSSLESVLRSISHFRGLFEVSSSISLTSAMDNIFLFVHEMKGLLQQCRSMLDMQTTWPLSRQLEEIRKAVKYATSN